MEAKNKGNKPGKPKYDVPDLVDPATLPKDKVLERSNQDPEVPRKDVPPAKVRRIL